ncbi:MAG TPA: hypothetical protein VD999_00735 [Vitreimonas sp.]|nr:hypothetical protein [Vitreimonas sp.]
MSIKPEQLELTKYIEAYNIVRSRLQQQLRVSLTETVVLPPDDEATEALATSDDKWWADLLSLVRWQDAVQWYLSHYDQGYRELEAKGKKRWEDFLTYQKMLSEMFVRGFYSRDLMYKSFLQADEPERVAIKPLSEEKYQEGLLDLISDHSAEVASYIDQHTEEALIQLIALLRKELDQRSAPR